MIKDGKNDYMDYKQQVEVYHLIKKILNLKKSTASSLCEELYRLYSFEKEDLVQELICIFLTRNHKPIRNLKAYVSKFCYHELMNMKRKYNSTKYCSNNLLVSYDTIQDCLSE